MFKNIHIFRVKPDDDLLQAITQYCTQNRITSAVILGIIGSLKDVRLNFIKSLPGNYETAEYTGPLEIVCAQGSVAVDETALIVHIHLQISSGEISRGGHLDSSKVFSTAEVVLGELNYQLKRRRDQYTGLNELVS